MKALLLLLSLATIAAAPAEGPRLLRTLAPVPEHSIELANVLLVRPSEWRLRAVRARTLLGKERATLPEIMAAVPEARAGINASFFSLKDGKLVGFFMEDGRVAEHYQHRSMDRIFFARADGEVGVVRGTRLDPRGVVSAVSGKSAWEESSRSARTALCIDAEGLIRLVSAYPVGDLAKMTDYLVRAEGCREIVHLDGGGSSQMSVRGELSVGWERDRGCESAARQSPGYCHRPVPAFLLVVPKS